MPDSATGVLPEHIYPDGYIHYYLNEAIRRFSLYLQRADKENSIGKYSKNLIWNNNSTPKPDSMIFEIWMEPSFTIGFTSLLYR